MQMEGEEDMKGMISQDNSFRNIMNNRIISLL